MKNTGQTENPENLQSFHDKRMHIRYLFIRARAYPSWSFGKINFLSNFALIAMNMALIRTTTIKLFAS